MFHSLFQSKACTVPAMASQQGLERSMDSGSIDIEGNLELSQAVYASMYQILSSTRADWPYGLSPGGLSGGEEYMGHTFWDMDIWMFPFLLLLYPDLAKASLKYRYDRLPAARRIARVNKYRGKLIGVFLFIVGRVPKYLYGSREAARWEGGW